jgi:hypothetical protein
MRLKNRENLTKVEKRARKYQQVICGEHVSLADVGEWIFFVSKRMIVMHPSVINSMSHFK